MTYLEKLSPRFAVDVNQYLVVCTYCPSCYFPDAEPFKGCVMDLREEPDYYQCFQCWSREVKDE